MRMMTAAKRYKETCRPHWRAHAAYSGAGMLLTLGLYSALRACNAMVFRSNLQSRFTVATMFCRVGTMPSTAVMCCCSSVNGTEGAAVVGAGAGAGAGVGAATSAGAGASDCAGAAGASTGAGTVASAGGGADEDPGSAKVCAAGRPNVTCRAGKAKDILYFKKEKKVFRGKKKVAGKSGKENVVTRLIYRLNLNSADDSELCSHRFLPRTKRFPL